jgi:hypothetical protein
MTKESGIDTRQGQGFLSYSQLPEQLFCQGQRDGREDHHSSPGSVKVENARKYISIPPYVFITWL